MKRKILAIVIIGIFFSMVFVTSGASIKKKNRERNINTTATGKGFTIIVIYKNNRVPDADVEVWDGRNQENGIYIMGRTNSNGVFRTSSEGVYFDPDARVHIHAEKNIEGEGKKAANDEHVTTSEGDFIRFTLVLDDPKGILKNKNQFEFPILKNFLSMFHIFENLI